MTEYCTYYQVERYPQKRPAIGKEIGKVSERIVVPKIGQKGTYQRTGAAITPPFLRPCSVGADRLAPFRFAASSTRRWSLSGVRRRLAFLSAPWTTTLLLLLLFLCPLSGAAVSGRTGKQDPDRPASAAPYATYCESTTPVLGGIRSGGLFLLRSEGLPL